MSLFYLGAVFLAAGYVYQRIQWFEGKICIEKGKAEHVVVRESSAEEGVFAEERNLPLELISFDNPRTARSCFDDKAVYDAVTLPFRLYLEDVVILEERPAREVLEVIQQGRKTPYPVETGVHFPLGTDSGTILGVQRWTGLLPHPSGQPMAAVSCHPPGEAWGAPLFLARGAWRMIAKSMALYLDWFENEALAKEKLPEELPGLESARWGVVEGQNTHWFNTFRPGAGMRLQDGTEVALLRFEERHGAPEEAKPALLFSVNKNGTREEGWVYANGCSKDGSIRFEYPGQCETVLILHGWQDGVAWAKAFHKGQAWGEIKLMEKQPWRPPGGFPHDVCADQIIQQAVPVGDDTAPVQALSLQLPSGIIHLREGETHAGNDYRIHYLKRAQAPVVRYVLDAVREGKKRQYMLSPEGSFQHGFWRFRQATENPHAGTIAVLEAERTLGGYSQLVGACLFVAGAFGWVVIRFKKDKNAR